MSIRFIHTADVHLGKTYRGAAGELERYEDFFRCLADIVADALREKVDFVLIAGDLFHTGQILPRTFARTIEVLAPLKEAGIACIAVEGNHDWIHRRDRLSWMEALSQMGYLKLLRPERTEEGGYSFLPFNQTEGTGGHLEIAGWNIYGIGYIGAQAGSHVSRICEAVTTERNLLLFHVGIWQYSPVEIGNMKPEEAAPLAETFTYLALGHGHKPYIIKTETGTPYGFNPGSPECVNFGEQHYPKGYYLVTLEPNAPISHEFRSTRPRPMHSLAVDLDGAPSLETALERFRTQVTGLLATSGDQRRPLLDLKITGKVGFHPFELSREQVWLELESLAAPLHVEIRNLLSLVTGSGSEATAHKSLEEIEREVLGDLIASASDYQARKTELVDMAIALRRMVCSGSADEDELLALLEKPEESPQKM